jgi:DNA-binding NarL/FixJ family response regulator
MAQRADVLRVPASLRRGGRDRRLPAPPGRSLRLLLRRDSGGFTERDKLLAELLHPHLHAVYQDAQRRQTGAPRLTARQWELLRLVAAGHSNADIARQLFLSENTVRKHLENIYQRLSVSSRTAAVALAFQSAYPTQPAGQRGTMNRYAA